MKLQAEFNRKMEAIVMRTENRRFNYEQPEMTYDKSTGDVIIHEKNLNAKSKIIRNLSDLEKEKAALENELNPKLSKKQQKRGQAPTEEERVQKYAEAYKEMMEETDIDPS